MQIQVVGGAPTFSAQVKAYAEYKVFSRLAPLARRIGVVTIVLTGGSRPDEPVCCAMTAALGAAGSLTSRVHRRQPIAAIDGAVAGLADVVSRRLEAGSHETDCRSGKGARG